MELQDLLVDGTASIEQDKDKNTITIKAGDSTKRLSNIIKDFPDNCYVNKQITGCGGTTLVLRNDVNYVVLVPYVNLLTSKEADNCLIVDLTVIHGEKKGNKYIIDYLKKDSQPKKIICTFDSLPRLLDIDEFDPKQFKLLVDEAHTLVNLGSFKASTCEFVLQNYHLFKSYVFLTATPTKRDYFPDLIGHLPLCTIEWDNVKAVKFNLQRIDKGVGLNKALFGLCYDYLTGKTEGNAHIFYNSVNEIIDVIKKIQEIKDKSGNCVFSKDDIRVICADGNKDLMRKKLGKDWGKIGKITEPVAKINLYTASCFEGADIYDEDGQTYIIINGVRDSTKVDFHVLIPQIVGRIRDSKRNEHINILVGNLPDAAKLTREQWIAHVTKSIQNSTDVLNDLITAKLTEASRSTLRKAALSDKYTFEDREGNLYISDVALKAELQAYEALQATYVVREVQGAEIDATGYSATFRELLTDESKHEAFAHVPTGIAKFLNDSTQCFTDTMKEYCEARDTNNTFLSDLVDVKDESFKNYYDVLGHEKIKALRYRETDITHEYAQATAIDSKDLKIKALLDYKPDDIITKADLKVRIQEVYKELGIEKLAKATHITEWYEVKATKLDRIYPAFKIIKLKMD
ncbi:DEAD/DEAH box helicase family protein [Acinetobacter lwoffii]|uniref:DEAD/DEAH box helicase family protein n=1 Tax=Acinetobacter lwoffii TaxID=28090 RepID=UPI00168D30FF|nr:DEAD/DEAH box helicase family protein [Acinetobacter lwoffii]